MSVRVYWVEFNTQASSTNTYTYAGSGSLTFSGAGTTAWISLFSYSGSGTLTFSGTGTTAYVPAGSTTYSYNGSGSLAFSGAGTTAWTSIFGYTGSGSIAFSGGATTTYTPGLYVYPYSGSGSIVFSGAATTSGPIVRDESQAGGGSKTSTKPRIRKIIIERVDDVEDLVEQLEEEVKEEPKVKPKLRKAKKLRPETVETTEANAQAWIDYYNALADSLRDQQRADELRQALDQSAHMIRAMAQQRELQNLLNVAKKRIQDEEELMLLLMAA